MKEDSKNVKSRVKTPSGKEGPCAGGVPRSGKAFRVLKCKRDRRVTRRVPIQPKESDFDPTAWYLYEVERNKEITCRELLNDPKIGFDVDAYVAVQIKVRRKAKTDDLAREERVVIHGKIFVRTAEAYRVEVMKKCPYIKRCVINPVTSSKSFARIPDKQIELVKEFLKEKVRVNFSEQLPEYVPQVNDSVQVIGGILSQDAFDVQGEVIRKSGRYATLAIDGVGYLWKVPVKDLAKRV